MESLLKSRRGASGGEREREGGGESRGEREREREREGESRVLPSVSPVGMSVSPVLPVPAVSPALESEMEGEKSSEGGEDNSAGVLLRNLLAQKGVEAGDMEPEKGKVGAKGKQAHPCIREQTESRLMHIPPVLMA